MQWWNLDQKKNESHARQAKTTQRSRWHGENKKCNHPYPSPGWDDATLNQNAMEKSYSTDLKRWALAEGKSVVIIYLNFDAFLISNLNFCKCIDILKI